MSAQDLMPSREEALRLKEAMHRRAQLAEKEVLRLSEHLDRAHEAIRLVYDAWQGEFGFCLPPDVPRAVRMEFKTALAGAP